MCCRWFAKRFLHPDIVALYSYIFLWDEDIGVENFHPGRLLVHFSFRVKIEYARYASRSKQPNYENAFVFVFIFRFPSII